MFAFSTSPPIMQYFSEKLRISGKIWENYYWEMAYESGVGDGKKAGSKNRKTPLKTLKIPPTLSWTIESEEQWVNAEPCSVSADRC